MKFIILILILVFATACSTNMQHFDYTKSADPWIDAFKDKMFFECLRESYKNDSIFKMIENKDAFNPYDGLTPEAIGLARRTGKMVAQNIPPPAMCENCKEGENYYMSTCLHYYKSKELDSIAHAAYRDGLQN